MLPEINSRKTFAVTEEKESWRLFDIERFESPLRLKVLFVIVCNIKA